jgi:hypothetical protein
VRHALRTLDVAPELEMERLNLALYQGRAGFAADARRELTRLSRHPELSGAARTNLLAIDVLSGLSSGRFPSASGAAAPPVTGATGIPFAADAVNRAALSQSTGDPEGAARILETSLESLPPWDAEPRGLILVRLQDLAAARGDAEGAVQWAQRLRRLRDGAWIEELSFWPNP